ncbi:MAG TPA: HAD family hydrolase [Clostridia bacterium]|nr:HAD family hydrolase [Clostridia bacterium]
MDDTLVHSKIDFDTLGKWMRRELVDRGIARDGRELAAMSVSQLLQLADLFDREHGTGHGAELWRKVEEAEMEGMARATVEDGAPGVLAELKARGFVLCILTNNTRLVATTVLRKFSLDQYIDTLMTREEVTRLKPDPEGLLRLKEKYREQVDRVFFVGDSWIDGLAANRAGIPFIGFNCLEPRDVEMVDNVSNLRELVRLLREISPLEEGGCDG